VIKQTKGSAIFFPSFAMHRVTPVTDGVRRSLVVWMEGPRFK
jgi:PKHD-type hydroxylase